MNSWLLLTNILSKIEETKLSNIRVRIYKPKSIEKNDKLPIMVYYHGGGYVFGSLSKYAF